IEGNFSLVGASPDTLPTLDHTTFILFRNTQKVDVFLSIHFFQKTYTVCISRCLSSIRRIFPDDVFGNFPTNSIFLGYLLGAVDCLTWFCSSFTSTALEETLSCSTINAFTTLPRISSGLATTAHSFTASCLINASSTSNGPMV